MVTGAWVSTVRENRNWSEFDVCKHPSLHADAAALLMNTFQAKGITSWPNIESARQTLDECIAVPNLCLGMLIDGKLAGWVGLRPMYDKTWELHPLVVAPAQQGQGVGKALLQTLEQRAKAQGLIGIVLGTDDELFETSLSQTDLNGSNVLAELKRLSNRARHPFEFYQKCGYSVIGAVPNANGKNKPDIMMWKDLSADGV
ncbi:AAC(6')-Ia family aminoglycoside 6'-N-acetyltransferase [Saccharospirillum impatiens]|uniref:AAC(6')-Ia family aminoglycoside 6'-N-acetyltransferase n=1 Tax=Saccharospirillum impatiens TaxID=169438 RepID=UPI0006852DA8|nr:AAC(6')-Ia family aminoglycoside 6'-N-acetyltransferase [Saccharospirillum impatiens]